MKPSANAPDRIFFSAYWSATGITPGSAFPYEIILTATAIRELIRIQEADKLTPAQGKALQYAKDRLLACGDVAAASFPSTTENPVRVSFKHRRTGEWTSIEAPHTPEALAAQWGGNFWTRLCAEANNSRALEQQRKAKGPRFDVPNTPLCEPITEKLLQTWLADTPDTKDIAGNRYNRTAQLGEVSLWTRPKQVMDRPSPFHQYQETDGLGYIFIDGEGQSVDDFTGSRNMPGPKQATFEWFGSIQGLGAATWAADTAPYMPADPEI